MPARDGGGASLTFDNFTATILEVDEGPIEADVIDTTHLQTLTHETAIPSRLFGARRVEVKAEYDPGYRPAVGSTGTLAITFPGPPVQTDSYDAVLEGFEVIGVSQGDKIISAVEFLLIPVAAVVPVPPTPWNPAVAGYWIGFWLHGPDTAANRISGASGGDCDKAYYTYFIHSRGTSPLSPLPGGYSSGSASIVSSGATRSTSPGQIALTSYTFGYWVYRTGTGTPILYVLDSTIPNGIGHCAYIGDNNGGSTVAAVTSGGSATTAAFAVPINTWTHVVGRVDAPAKTVTLFVDGIIKEVQAFGSAPICPAEPGLVFATKEVGTAVTAGFCAGMFLFSGLIPNDIIAKLAAGSVPDISGGVL